MTDVALYRRLLRQARPYWLHLAGLFGIGLLASPLALLDPVPLKIVFDSVLGSHPLPVYVRAVLPSAVLGSAGALLVAIGLLLGVAALTQLQALANRFMQAYVGERLVLGLRTQLVQHAQRLSLSYHDSKGSADSLYRIQQDAAVIDKIMVEGIIPFVAAAVTLVMMIVVTLRLDWQLALVALGVSPPLFVLSRLYRPRMRRQSRQVKKLESSALAVVQETLDRGGGSAHPHGVDGRSLRHAGGVDERPRDRRGPLHWRAPRGRRGPHRRAAVDGAEVPRQTVRAP